MAGVIDSYAVARTAERIGAAQRDRVPCSPVRDLLDPGDLAAGYSVHRLLTEVSVQDGRRLVGPVRVVASLHEAGALLFVERIRNEYGAAVRTPDPWL
jgi:hypothetical protein